MATVKTHNLRVTITAHLKKYNKTELIDSTWIDEMLFVLERLAGSKIDLLKYGAIHKTKTGYSAKSGYLQAYETYLKMYGAISGKLGLSPHDREKWKIEIEKTKSKLIK